MAVRSERHRDTFDIGLRSFVNEARLLAQFDHPSLVKVYRFWEANGTAYMVMPFYQRARRCRTRSRSAARRRTKRGCGRCWRRCIEALEVLHARQAATTATSRPTTSCCSTDGTPLLLDFGAARRVIGDMTQALTVILKPGYAPIEQYADMPGMKQGPWTDVYALAAVVYFMITKRKPPAAVSRMMQDSYEPLMQSDAAARYSPQLLQGIDRCLALRAEDRPQSMAAMREAIGLAMPPGRRSGSAAATAAGQAGREDSSPPRWQPRAADRDGRASRRHPALCRCRERTGRGDATAGCR